MTRQALGRGLAGMLQRANTAAAPAADAVASGDAPALLLPLNQIQASPYQPRQTFDDEKLAELAASIGALGLVQPLVVRRLDAAHYQLVAGERRLRAVTMLGWKEVPVSVCNAPEDNLRTAALVENLQREDLNAIEISEALQELLKNSNGLTHEQIAERLGKSRAWITNSLRLLNLPQEVRDFVANGQISGAHGRTLLGLPDALSQINMAKRVIKEEIPVQKLEKMVQQALGGKKPKAAKKTPPAADPEMHLADTEKRLGRHLGTKVRINDHHGQGKIEIDYYSYDEIAGILDKLGLTQE